MRLAMAMALGIVALVGCNNRSRETGAAGSATDTTVTTRQTQDTTLVTHDTSIDVDTTVKHGDRATAVDTTKKTGPGESIRMASAISSSSGSTIGSAKMHSVRSMPRFTVRR